MYLVYLVILGGGLLLYFEQSRALLVVVIFVGFLSFIFSYLVDFKANIRKTRFSYMNFYLIQFGDPETYLREVEKDLQNVKGEFRRNIFIINKAACLSTLGKFQEALDTLYFLKPEYLTKEIQTFYYNALLSNYLLSNDIFMAERILKENSIHFSINPNQDINLNLIVEINQGMYEFYTGNISNSKEIFQKLTENKKKKGIRAFALYFLGLIELNEGNKIDGVKKLQKCIEINKKSFVAREAKKLIGINKE